MNADHFDRTVSERAVSVPFLQYCFWFLAALLWTASASALEIRVNAGGSQFTDGVGNVWSADTGFNTGRVSSAGAGANIIGTADDPLYQLQRFDDPPAPELMYSFTVPNGDYTVNLLFAENYSGVFAPGARVFSVNMEGAAVISGLDIFATVGANTAMMRSVPVTVGDGQLNIQFIHQVQNPIVAAIEILSAGGPPGTADLAVTKTVDDASPLEGQSLVYTVTVTNNGPSDATGVNLTDVLPAGLTYVSDDSVGAYDDSTGLWTVGSVTSGSAAQLNITATVDAGTLGSTLTNTASVSAINEPDPVPDNDSASVPVTVTPPFVSDQVHLAWVDDPSTTLTVVWRTMDLTTPSTVEYRPVGDVTWLSASGALRSSGTAGTLHETLLTSLTPSTEYEYRVMGDGGLWSQIYTTRTAPASGPADFDVVFVADTGLIGRLDGLATGTEQVINEIAALDPLLVLGGGDYAYYDTDTRFGSLDETIDAWFAQMAPIMSRSPFMPTYGNHEIYLGEGYDPWAARFPTPDGLNNRRFYSFDVGDVHFISILGAHSDNGISAAELQWVQDDIIAANDAGQRWIIPYFHVPPFSDGSNHPSNLNLRNQFGPLFESLGVKIVLTTHDQSYERTFPLTDVPATNTPTTTALDGYTLSHGVTWVKVSPGGKLSNINGSFSDFDTIPPPAWTAVRDNTMHHFARLAVSAAGTLRVEIYGVVGDGTPPVIQDSFEYSAVFTPDVDPPTVPTNVTATAVGATQVDVSWDASTDAGGGVVAGYNVFRNDVGFVGTATGTGFSDTTVVASGTYSYTVTAFDNATPTANESAPSAPSPNVTTPTPDTQAPSVPGNVNATAASATQVDVSWDASTDAGGGVVAGYKVFRADVGLLATVTSGTSYSDTSVVANTSYDYTVAAFDNATPTANESAPSSPPATVTTPVPPAVVIRVNAGGAQYTDGVGNVWSADTGFNTGVLSTTTANIIGTTDDPLYQKQRYDSAGGPELIYSFAVPNGDYAVNLHFADNYSGTFGTGLRVFDVLMEGALVLNDVDIFTEAGGGNRPLVRAVPTVTVSDGQLNIQFNHQTQNPIVGAIEILSAAPPVPDTDPPTVPTNVSASAVSATQVDVSWTGSTDVGGGVVAGYRVFRNDIGEVGTTTGTSFSDTTVLASSTYSYTVTAFDNATPANESAPSAPSPNVTTPTPDVDPPTVPTGVNATAVSATRVDVSWTASTDVGGGSVAGYKVFRADFGLLATVTSGTSYSDTSVVASTSYDYTVTAFDNASPANESLPSSPPANAVTPTPPAVAIRVNAGGAQYTDGAGKVWSADTGFNTGVVSTTTANIIGTTDDPLYQNQRYDKPGGAELIYSFAVPNGDYAVNLHFADNYSGTFGTGLRVFDVLMEGALVLNDVDIFTEAGGGNRPLVRAVPTVTVSDGQLNIQFNHQTQNPIVGAIEILSAAPPVPDTDPPTVPTNVSASAVSATQVDVSWTGSTDVGGGVVAGYNVSRNDVGFVGTTTGTSFSDTTVLASSTYSYTVTAFDNATPANESAPSAPSPNVTTPAPPDTDPPTVPTGVNATAVGSTQVDVSWTGSTDVGGGTVAGYNVYRNDIGFVGTTTGTGFSDTSVSPDSTYSYTVSAFDDATPANESAPSSPSANVTTPADTLPPSIPTNVTATATSATQVDVGWDASTDAGGGTVGGYYVYRDDVGLLATVTGTSYSDTSVLASTSYAYTVAAFDDATPGNESAQSSPPADVTTPAQDLTAPSVPQNVSANAVTETLVEVIWDPSTDAGGGTVAGYNVFRDDVGLLATVAGTIFSDTSVVAGNTYNYTVSAFDNATPANESAQSSPPASVTTPLAEGCPSISPLACSSVRVNGDYTISFTGADGGITDMNGVGTGFTMVDPPTNPGNPLLDPDAPGYWPEKLTVDTGVGKLRITGTPGIQYQANNSLDNALGIGLNLPSASITIEATLSDFPSGPGGWAQAGVWFGGANNFGRGTSEDNYIKFVVGSPSTGTYVLQINMEQAGASVASTEINLPANPGTVTLKLFANPVDRTVQARYNSGSGEQILRTFSNVPDEWFSFDQAGIDPSVATRSYGGIFATSRMAPAPVTFSFDSFSVTQSAATGGDGTFDFGEWSIPVPSPTAMAVGPDNRLYVTEVLGTLHAITLDHVTRTVVDDQVINTVKSAHGGNRLTLGITVDPASTAEDVVLWVSHSSGSINNGGENSGVVSRLSGTNFSTIEDRITGLPRAIANHAINNIRFGPDGKLYIAAGGNTGAGAPNLEPTEFGDRPEQPLSAAMLVADVNNPAFQGDCATPVYQFGIPATCDVAVYASGLRNTYDLFWHHNGTMYAPDNGLGVTGTYPPFPTPDCTGLANANTNNPGTQADLLNRIVEGKYYGHPNPYRDECVFKDGSYQGVAPLPNYEPPMFNLGNNRSADGIIEYLGDAFYSKLMGQLLISNYSTGDDITRIKLSPDGTSVINSASLIGGFIDPLPLAQDASGNIYVGEFSAQRVTILVPLPLFPAPPGDWAPRQPLPEAVLDAGGAALDDRFYTVAGKTSSSHISSMNIYNPVSDSWSAGPDLPGVAVENPAVVAYAGKLYVFGGSTGPFSGAVANAAVFDPATSGWTTLAPMATGRGGATAQVIDDKIYVVGGLGGDGASLDSVEIYDPAGNSWSAGTPMQTRRDNPGSAVFNGKLYIFGGRTRNADGSTLDGTLATVEIFDPAGNSWSYGSPMPTGRRTMVVGTISGRAQVMGGESPVFAQNEEYDPATDSWRALTSMSVPRHGAAGATIRGTVYVAGGGPVAGSSFTTANEAFAY